MDKFSQNCDELGNGCINIYDNDFDGLFMLNFVVGYRNGFQWKKSLNS